MALLGRNLAISISDKVLEDKDSLREKTAKLGLVARACAIYGVDVIEIFTDARSRGEDKFIRRVLEYLDTPQYLRKRLYPLDEVLRYAGALPPLRIPSHKPRVALDRLRVGEVREGVANGDGTVDVGLDAAPKLEGAEPRGKRLTVRIASLKPLVARSISRDDAGDYWGYVIETKTIEEVLSEPRFPLKIATSRLGAPLTDVLADVRASFRRATGVKVIFGSPSKGLFDIVGRDLPKRVQFVVNLFPEQKVETVRSEEAIFAALGLVGILSAEKA